jgi:hypothetical protein
MANEPTILTPDERPYENISRFNNPKKLNKKASAVTAISKLPVDIRIFNIFYVPIVSYCYGNYLS